MNVPKRQPFTTKLARHLTSDFGDVVKIEVIFCAILV